MAKVLVLGEARKVDNDHIIEATNFFLERLLRKNTSNSLLIEVIPTKNLKKFPEYIDAETIWLDRATKPRQFRIWIERRLSYKNFISAIAHETVHIKQFVKGELIMKVPSIFKWKGILLKSNIDYWETPWEIDAHGREPGLWYKWSEYKKKQYEKENL